MLSECQFYLARSERERWDYGSPRVTRLSSSTGENLCQSRQRERERRCWKISVWSLTNVCKCPLGLSDCSVFCWLTRAQPRPSYQAPLPLRDWTVATGNILRQIWPDILLQAERWQHHKILSLISLGFTSSLSSQVPGQEGVASTCPVADTHAPADGFIYPW